MVNSSILSRTAFVSADRNVACHGFILCQMLFLHEAGHNLSLLHTMMTGDGTCSYTHDDDCNDTLTMGEIVAQYGFNPCDDIWGCNSNCSNNLMDYSGHRAVTPDQLGRIYWTIANEMNNYLQCYIPSGNVQLCDDDFLRQNIFSESVTIGGQGCGVLTKLESGRSTTITFSNQVTIQSNFEVELGSMFSVQPTCY